MNPKFIWKNWGVRISKEIFRKKKNNNNNEENLLPSRYIKLLELN